MEFNFLRERIDRILHLISESYKVIDGPKKGPKGLTVVLEKGVLEPPKPDVNKDQQIIH